MNNIFDRVNSTVEYIKSKIGNFSAEIGIVLGSGLGEIVNDIKEKKIVPYGEIPSMPKSTVQGHKGNFVFGTLGNKKVMIMQGRVHFYEGYTLQEISIPIRTMKRLGIKSLILTSAVGGIKGRLPLKPTDIVIVKDHINNLGDNPLAGEYNSDFGEMFPDMSEVYSKKLRQLVKKVAAREKIKVYEGIYIINKGPSYETPAEIKAYKKLGADVAGMSLVPEAIVAHQCGIDVLGICYISNLASGISKNVLTHEEVLKNAEIVADKFYRLLKGVVEII